MWVKFRPIHMFASSDWKLCMPRSIMSQINKKNLDIQKAKETKKEIFIQKSKMVSENKRLIDKLYIWLESEHLTKPNRPAIGIFSSNSSECLLKLSPNWHIRVEFVHCTWSNRIYKMENFIDGLWIYILSHNLEMEKLTWGQVQWFFINWECTTAH